MTDHELDGMTLAQWLAQGPLEPEKALNILEQLLASLEASHDLGLVHGSISPEKIILTPDGKASLIGFPGRDPGVEPMPRHAKGAAEPGYVAPEQITDDPVGRRTDLYSVGVVAYAMLTGKDPFGASEGVAADNVYYRILYKPSPHVPDAALVGLPAGVGPAIDQAMVKEPQARFTDAKSFLEALRTDTAIVAAVPVTPARPRRERDSRGWMPYALAGGVIVLLLVIGLGVAYATGGIGGSPETTIAAIETTTTRAAAVDDSTTTTTTEPATTTTPETTTTTVTTTTTTLPPSSTTLSTVSSTTTTAKPTTTTAKPTTTTLKTATITVKDATATYNGSSQHPSVTTSPAGLSVSYSITPTNAGYYSVTITVTSLGYKGSTTAYFTIEKANASISVPNRTVTWTGDPYGLTGGTATGVNGENLSSLLNVDSTTYVGEQTATNTYAIGWSFSGNANYNSASGSAQLTIEAAPVETTTTTTTTTEVPTT